ncbi:MAG: hypothetical protein EZS28_040696, partial [Streblomastix strix]
MYCRSINIVLVAFGLVALQNAMAPLKNADIEQFRKYIFDSG